MPNCEFRRNEIKLKKTKITRYGNKEKKPLSE
jgi:hypothetical protein